MQKYFIHDGQKQLGPFSASELIKRNITACTPVFTPVAKCYVPASEIPELNEIIEKGIGATGSKKRISPAWKWSIAVVTLIVIALISFWLFNLEKAIPDTPAGPSLAALTKQHIATGDKESVDPSQYLLVRGNMHDNLLGRKIIKGKITNLASLTGYSDLKMAVTFLSGTQQELQTQDFIVNKVVKPNAEIYFRDVLNAPEGTKGFKIRIVSAIPTR